MKPAKNVKAGRRQDYRYQVDDKQNGELKSDSNLYIA
jgi:hypothetical protein